MRGRSRDLAAPCPTDSWWTSSAAGAVPKIGLKAPVPKKMDGSSSLPGCDLAKMIRKHPLLVLLSVLCKSLQRSLIFITLPFSAYALFGKAGAKVRRFLIPSKCFERKVCESWRFFALFYKIRVKRGCFGGKGRKKGWRKRSIPTHSGWLYPLTFDAGKGLKEA